MSADVHPVPLPRSCADRPEDAPDPAWFTLVQQRVLDWYAAHGRDLPWRQTHDPYAILVAEIMLQQTGVERVLSKYAEFLVRFPTLHDLAGAPAGAVIRAWAGLGYNSRAVRLHNLARQIMAEHGGVFPSTVGALRPLHGVGPYTAGAVACFAFDQQVAFLDTNIRRVLLRVFVGPDPIVAERAITEKSAQSLADAVMPAGQAYNWHQALMDLGASACTAYAPTCLLCPIGQHCRSFGRAVGTTTIHELRESGPEWQTPPSDQQPRPTRRHTKEPPFVGSTRYYRGRIVSALRDLPLGETLPLVDVGRRAKPDFQPDDIPWLAGLLEGLARDGLVLRHHDQHRDSDKSSPANWRVSLP